MTTPLKQSTAATIVLGPFVDNTDGYTPETALTISQADIRLSKNGGAFAQTNNAAGATHMENGNYSVPLDATDTNTIGRLRVAVYESGALSVWRDFEVLDARAYARCVDGATFNERGGRVWYVATTGNSANPGTFSQPLDTFANAQSAASAGDTIYMKSGTHTTASTITITKAGIEVVGESRTGTILSNSGGIALVIAANNVTVRDMKIATTSDVNDAIQISGTIIGTTIENCWLLGRYDILWAGETINTTVRDCRLEGTWDGLTAYLATNLHVERCHIVTTGSNPLIPNAYPVIGLRAGNSTGRAVDCTISATRNTAAATGYVAGADAGYPADDSVDRGSFLFDNVKIYAKNLHASSTGNAYGYTGYSDSGTDYPMICNIRGGNIHVAVTGSGSAKDGNASVSASSVTVVGANTLAANWLGAENVRFLDAFPANFSSLGINASGHVSRVTLTDTATALTEDIAAVNAAQVHNQEPVDSFVVKLGSRRDGVVNAFPTLRIAPDEVTQVWVDCSRLLGRNANNVTNVASSNANIVISSSGLYGKYVSIVLDASAASDGDTATVTCDVVPFSGQVIKASISVEVDDD